MNKLKLASVLTLFVLLLQLSDNASACTIMEFMQTYMQPNSTSLSNEDRLKIAEMVLDAKKWPDVQIGANVTAGAYVKERNIDSLKDLRANDIQNYLTQLGLQKSNIWIDKLTFTENMAHDDRGNFDLHQIAIQLVPICNGGCERLCNDPRVTPNSKAIK